MPLYSFLSIGLLMSAVCKGSGVVSTLSRRWTIESIVVPWTIYRPEIVVSEQFEFVHEHHHY